MFGSFSWLGLKKKEKREIPPNSTNLYLKVVLIYSVLSNICLFLSLSRRTRATRPNLSIREA